MCSIEKLEQWLTVSAESEVLEFKEAANTYSAENVLKYCVALANEGGGYLVLGVTDTSPRRVVGTQAFASRNQLNKLKLNILKQVHIRVDAKPISHPDGRVLVFKIPSRPIAQPLKYKERYLMRSGESVVGMTADHMKKIFAEDSEDWFTEPATENINAADVIALLNTQTYFDLLKQPYPSTQENTLARLANESLITAKGKKWIITNLGAILLAKSVDQFPSRISRKALRFIVYDGTNKLNTVEDLYSASGYAVGFEVLVHRVYQTAPKNRIIGDVIRKEIKMFPLRALRELIANALIHQDFSVSGASVMIEMYADRVEISNPGNPPISTERFIDEYNSRNEKLAGIMRRFGICEEQGSGVDKVIIDAETHQLPAPDFRVGEIRTTAILFAYKEFSKMDRRNRIRACYQHCCLRHVCNEDATNSTLRKRFQLADNQTATVTQVIKSTIKDGWIKLRKSESASTRFACYLPFWG